MLHKSLLSLLIFDIFLLNVTSLNNTGGIFVLRNTTYGQVLGKLIQTENFKAEVFLGVPYAKPPLNELRFEVIMKFLKLKFIFSFRASFV